MAERVLLTIDGHPAGDCDAEIFELTKLYLSSRRLEVDVARILESLGIDNAVTIVVNAKRELGLLRTSQI